MLVGEKVVCVDDKFDAHIKLLYTELPVKDVTYVIRESKPGMDLDGQPAGISVLLVGVTNPQSDNPPFHERGFNSMRFRPLEEIKEANKAGNLEPAWVREAIEKKPEHAPVYG